jgi:low affinity Fe/Cu permease
MRNFFRIFAQKSSDSLGSPWAFVIGCVIVFVWAFMGPLMHYSEMWQLIINTGTTIATFLMMFLIQNAQNRDALAIHLKLDEVIRAVDGARNSMLNLESFTDDELAKLQDEFKKLGKSKAEEIVEQVEQRRLKHKKSVTPQKS